MAHHILRMKFLLLALSQAEADSSGKMTMWSLKHDVIVGSKIAHEGGPSACQFADPRNGGLKSPAAGSPYVKGRKYCAADIHTLFDNGKACGRCYKISFGGSGGSDGGRAGSEVIQVVNSGHMAHNAVFDCQVDAFEAITGARTGVYPINYEEVDCDQSNGGGVATVLAGGNAWYTKVLFSNLVRPATAVSVVAGGKRHKLEMQPCCGTWAGQLGGESAHVGFELTHDDGTTTSFKDCFKSWPVKTSVACSGHQSGAAAAGPLGAEEGKENTEHEETEDKEEKEETHEEEASHGASEVECSASWGHDCRKNMCCKESGFKCYRKSEHWAECRNVCQKGRVDKHSSHPWDCADITQTQEKSLASFTVLVRGATFGTTFTSLYIALAAFVLVSAAIGLKIVRARRALPAPMLLTPEE